MKIEMLYEGKAKKVYSTADPQSVVIEFKDSLTAFNAQKKGSFPGKGAVNLELTCLLYEQFAKHGIKTHFLRKISETEVLCLKSQIVPLEVVVRNWLAGSTARKLGRQEGERLSAPLVEFYLKDDALGDPFVSDEQIVAFGYAELSTIEILKQSALKVNEIYLALAKAAGFRLVDFKVEFGRVGDQLVLADELSPDCSRLWDERTLEKFDKDRFRQDLGGVQQAYQEVLKRFKEVVR